MELCEVDAEFLVVGGWAVEAYRFGLAPLNALFMSGTRESIEVIVTLPHGVSFS